MALTTTADVKQYLGVTSTADDALIGILIERVQDRIETFCDRKFDSATYREWHDGRKQEPLLLDNWPVSAVKRVAWGAKEALTVKGSTTTDLRATVEVQDNQVVLSRYASNGTETASSVTFASNATTSALATSITALTGWTASSTNNTISLDLHRMGGQDALGRTVSLTYPDRSDIEYRVDEDAGVLWIVQSDWWDAGGSDVSNAWKQGRRNILVEYTAGYAAGSIPGDLELACIEMVGEAFRYREHDPSVASESLGDYAYTLASRVDLTSNDSGMAMKLAQWRDRRS